MTRPRSTAARQIALGHAAAVVLEEGVSALTFEGLARVSGVAKTTLYRHWPTRAELLRDTLNSMVEELPTLGTGSLRTDVHALVAAVPTNDDDERRLFFLLMEAAMRDPAVREARDAMIAERTQPIRDMVEAAMARGELHAGIDVDLAIDLVMGPMVARHLVRLLPISGAITDQVVDATIAALQSLR